MTQDDALIRQVSRLTVLASDKRRAERVRAICRSKLAPHRPRARRPFGPVVFAGLCLVYLSALLHDVLQLRDLL